MGDMHSETGSVGPENRTQDLARIRRSLSAIYHDINNPISIVVGNAELLMEMAVSAGLGPDFIDPLADIGKASEQISEHVERLMELKALVSD